MLMIVRSPDSGGTPTAPGQLTFVSMSWSMYTSLCPYLGHVTHYVHVWFPLYGLISDHQSLEI